MLPCGITTPALSMHKPRLLKGERASNLVIIGDTIIEGIRFNSVFDHVSP